MMSYTVLLRLGGEWREVARVTAEDASEAFKKAQEILPENQKHSMIGLELDASATEAHQRPEPCCR